MNAAELLAELHRLIASIDSKSIQEARRLHGGGFLRGVLDALAGACNEVATPSQITDSAPEQLSSPYVPSQIPSPTALPPAPAELSNTGTNFLPELSYLRKASDTKTARELYELLQKSGIKLMARKESKTQAIDRAARVLAEMEPQKQYEARQKLRVLLNIDENAGWVKVIEQG